MVLNSTIPTTVSDEPYATLSALKRSFSGERGNFKVFLEVSPCNSGPSQ